MNNNVFIFYFFYMYRFLFHVYYFFGKCFTISWCFSIGELEFLENDVSRCEVYVNHDIDTIVN